MNNREERITKLVKYASSRKSSREGLSSRLILSSMRLRQTNHQNRRALVAELLKYGATGDDESISGKMAKLVKDNGGHDKDVSTIKIASSTEWRRFIGQHSYWNNICQECIRRQTSTSNMDFKWTSREHMFEAKYHSATFTVTPEDEDTIDKTLEALRDNKDLHWETLDADTRVMCGYSAYHIQHYFPFFSNENETFFINDVMYTHTDLFWVYAYNPVWKLDIHVPAGTRVLHVDEYINKSKSRFHATNNNKNGTDHTLILPPGTFTVKENLFVPRTFLSFIQKAIFKMLTTLSRRMSFNVAKRVNERTSVGAVAGAATMAAVAPAAGIVAGAAAGAAVGVSAYFQLKKKGGFGIDYDHFIYDHCQGVTKCEFKMYERGNPAKRQRTH